MGVSGWFGSGLVRLLWLASAASSAVEKAQFHLSEAPRMKVVIGPWLEGVANASLDLVATRDDCVWRLSLRDCARLRSECQVCGVGSGPDCSKLCFPCPLACPPPPPVPAPPPRLVWEASPESLFPAEAGVCARVWRDVPCGHCLASAPLHILPPNSTQGIKFTCVKGAGEEAKACDCPLPQLRHACRWGVFAEAYAEQCSLLPTTTTTTASDTGASRTAAAETKNSLTEDAMNSTAASDSSAPDSLALSATVNSSKSEAFADGIATNRSHFMPAEEPIFLTAGKESPETATTETAASSEAVAGTKVNATEGYKSVKTSVSSKATTRKATEGKAQEANASKATTGKASSEEATLPASTAVTVDSATLVAITPKGISRVDVVPVDDEPRTVKGWIRRYWWALLIGLVALVCLLLACALSLCGCMETEAESKAEPKPKRAKSIPVTPPPTPRLLVVQGQPSPRRPIAKSCPLVPLPPPPSRPRRPRYHHPRPAPEVSEEEEEVEMEEVELRVDPVPEAHFTSPYVSFASDTLDITTPARRHRYGGPPYPLYSSRTSTNRSPYSLPYPADTEDAAVSADLDLPTSANASLTRIPSNASQRRYFD